MQVKLIPAPTEITDASLKQYLADCASVVRGVQPKDNERLFARLIKEGFGDTPSRMFEFIPCKLGFHTFLSYGGKFHQLFGFLISEGYYTNARELLTWGLSWDEIIPLVDFTHYRAVHVVAPYFLYGQASTHTQITSISHSNRYTESGLGYWKPSECDANEQEEWNEIVSAMCAPRDLNRLMREYGVTRREVYARGSDMLQYREFTLGGYLNNPNAWPHFINQRVRDPHTQLEMRSLGSMIEGVLK